jgi:UDPglucose 6-dehydrogenase
MRSGYYPRVTVIGTGYLGSPTPSAWRTSVTRYWRSTSTNEKIAKAAAGEAPFFEPGLEPLLRKNLDSGRLRFTTSFAEVGAFGDVHFLCVGTPEGEAGQADLSFVYAAADALAPHLTSECLIVGKSTVPVGTARQVMNPGPGGRPRPAIGRAGLESGVPARGVRGAGQPHP